MSNLTPTPTTSSKDVAIASNPNGIRMIVQAGPESYNRNLLSRDRCLEACTRLLETITEKGMTNELDKEAALYISRTKKTIKDMNERRAPVTKLFDQIRSEFTTLENAIDPTRAGTVPYQLQQLRNDYAARRHAEEEARQRAAEVARQAAIAKESYRTACKDDYKAQFNQLVISRINELTEMSSRMTLDTYTAIFDTLTGYDPQLPADWCPESTVRLPFNLPPEEARAIRTAALQSLIPQFKEQFLAEVGDYRQELLDRLPSKKTELERAAQASAAEKARIEAELKAREAAELARKEAERKARETEEAHKKEVEKATTEANSLFAMTATSSAYQPKTKVTKKIRVTSPDGYSQLFALWWSKEGCRLSAEELAKVFKKQITFCEKLANKEEIFIEHPGVEYVDDVKAK